MVKHGETPISSGRLKNIRARATKASIPFQLDCSDIEIPERCPVLGMKLNQPGCLDSQAHVDKIEPLKGYVKGNVIVISSLANRIKSNATPAQILQVAQFYIKLINKGPQCH